ncbi:hypothetical protein BV898_11205 [Hypsibius exemplaris]|uniref:Receptor ligand binding region domain-containing protein n=1 Tax=Hypsibius exemplaris TaxID=2072580 RepID=A0A1W0WHB0_HYPEX|nr:hypothetical protein BV898_11205 [Hypsibius exemplaris]
MAFAKMPFRVLLSAAKLLFILHHWALPSLIFTSLSVSALNVQILAPGFVNTPMPSTITLCGPAFATGTEYLNSVYNPTLNFTYFYVYDLSYGNCSSFTDETLHMVSQWMYQVRDPNSLTVIVSPSCTYEPYLSQIAAQWNILLITSTQSDITIRDKHLAPTWVSTNIYPAQHYGDAMLNLIQANNWTSVYVVEEDGPLQFYGLVGPPVKRTFEANGVQLVYLKYDGRKVPLNFTTLLIEFNARSRVMFFFGPAESLRILLIQAYSRKMTTSEYVYVAAISFIYKRYGVFTWNKGDKDDLIVRMAYRSVLLFTAIDLSQDRSANLTSFTARWRDLYLSDPFYRNQNLRDDPPTPFLAATEAGLEMLGQVLDEAITGVSSIDIWDGADLASAFWGRTFNTTTGRVSLDKYGDRLPFTSMSYYDGTQFVVFARSRFDSGSFQWENIRAVDWHGSPNFPPNEPYCGYGGDHLRCTEKDESERRTTEIAAVSVAAVAVCVIILAACLTYHRWHHNRGLHTQWFVLDPAFLGKKTKSRRSDSLSSLNSAARPFDNTFIP